jgi:predicted dehydrogenase
MQDVQIIYIATPHTSHYSLARLALEAGKHVLVEKPATLVADEWKALMALAKEKNVFLMEGASDAP